MEPNRFAAFIMTYERPEIILNTISRLRSQTFPPKLILVVDNSESYNTEIAVKELPKSGIEYLHVGFNSGPAGAANLGLSQLSKLGFRWIYWGDDDNPPRDNGVFEAMFRKIDVLEKDKIPVGVFSGKGAYFNNFSGRLRSLSNSELRGTEMLEVDAVAGGHTVLVNSEVVKSGALPTKKLFFAFEDLDFCLKVRKNGFKIMVDADDWLQIRRKHKKSHKNYQWRSSSFGKLENLDRDYYSSRNLLHIFYKNKLVFPFFILILKIWAKAILGFKFGWMYGKLNCKAQINAFFDFLKGKYGSL